jgi:hypothetical protein
VAWWRQERQEDGVEGEGHGFQRGSLWQSGQGQSFQDNLMGSSIMFLNWRNTMSLLQSFQGNLMGSSILVLCGAIR